jgi:hypothetical protein
LKYVVFMFLATIWVLGLLCGFAAVAFLFELLVLSMIIIAVRFNQGRPAMKLRPAYARKPQGLHP